MNREGLVVARHRREILLESADGSIINGLQRGRKIKPVTGDEVRWSLQADGTAVIEEILPRKTLLERIDSRGKPEAVAANVTLIVVVIAPEPAPDWGLVDRYLAAAAISGMQALLVRNKDDMPSPEIDGRLAGYADLAYPTLSVNARAASGIEPLRHALRKQRAVLVGQSGVGKSSLLNALSGSATQSVGSLSDRRKIGRHTTTASTLFRLTDNGELIDSPGVRRFAPALGDPQELVRGFVDLLPFLGECQFNDCRHEREPVCGVRAAVQSGQISPERYQSFIDLRATLEQLTR